MAKKINFDNAAKKMEGISDKINILMRNKLIIAIFLIVDGITFILNPNSSLAEMSRAILILVLLASLSTLLANLAVKPRDIKSIILSLIVLILGIVLYIYPDLISAYIQIILSVFIIGDGVMNIVNSLNLNKASKYTKFIAEKYNKIINKKKENKEEKLKDVNKNFNEGMEQQKERLIVPLKRIVGKTSNLPKLYIVTNVATIILGIFLLVFPDVSMVIWGIIFLYIGISDLLAIMKTMDISNKIKEKILKK